MYFPKSSTSTNSGLQFGTPRTINNSNNPQGNKITFSKYPALSKNNLNISTDETVTSYTKFQSRVKSPPPQSQTMKLEGKVHTRHATEITDSLDGSKTFRDNSNVVTLELEFQISTLKSEMRRIKEEYQRRLDNFGAEKAAQIELLTTKINNMVEQGRKDKLKIETFIGLNQTLTSENKSLLEKIKIHQTKLVQSIQKSQDFSTQSFTLKDQLKNTKIHESQLQSTINHLQAQIAQLTINLKNSDQRLHQIKQNQDHYKNLVLTMSQEKTLLNNRISQMIQDHAKLQNAQVISRSQQNTINFEKINQEQSQEIANLKKKINDILNQQESSSLKMLYENKIIIMERQIQQLKHRYQSPESTTLTHDRSQQQWKGIVEEKNREIVELKNMISSLQSKVTQLNKELLDTKSPKPITTQQSFQSQTQLSNLKIQIKGLKKALQTADQKLKYLITQGKKKDEFLKQYLSATVKKGEEFIFIENFFKKYEVEIPREGFSQINLRELRVIQELQEKNNYLHGRLYGGK